MIKLGLITILLPNLLFASLGEKSGEFKLKYEISKYAEGECLNISLLEKIGDTAEAANFKCDPFYPSPGELNVEKEYCKLIPKTSGGYISYSTGTVSYSCISGR